MYFQGVFLLSHAANNTVVYELLNQKARLKTHPARAIGIKAELSYVHRIGGGGVGMSGRGRLQRPLRLFWSHHSYKGCVCVSVCVTF